MAATRVSTAPDDRQRVGTAIRSARLKSGQTLADVADSSGVPVATISRIERGLSGGSFDKITKIAAALGRTFDDIARPPNQSNDSGRRALTRAGESQRFFNDRYRYEVHASSLRKKAMVPLDMWIDASTPPTTPDDWTQHAGEEFIYVLEGSITVFTEVYEPVTLATGESIYIDSSMPHAFATAERDAKPSRMLSICLTVDFSKMSSGTPDT